MKKNYEIDMCNGSIMDKLVSFAVPLIISNSLQLLFNAIDIIVVGNYSGSDALAAVGSTAALINLFTYLFVGVSLGVNVLVARLKAEGDKEEIHGAVHTSMAFALISGIAMMIIAIIFSKMALVLMDTPDNVLNQAALYMRIYFVGMPFFMMYNYGAAILRAVGDTKRPLYYLIFSGSLNAGLNVLLVTVFNMGVAGVAIATVFSQMISCVLVLRCLMKSEEAYKIEFKELKISWKYLSRIFSVGIPAGLQNTVISFSNVLLQTSVNSFGSDAMAGYTAVNNILGFLFFAVNAVTQACMSFTSQNYGARKFKRMDRVLIDCMILQVCMTLVLGGLAYKFGDKLISIYNQETDVIAYGMEILAITTLPYVFCGIMDLIAGTLRGMGEALVPMILSIIGTVGLRIVWIFGVFPYHRSLFVLFISYPASWILTIIMQVICFYFVRKRIRRVASE